MRAARHGFCLSVTCEPILEELIEKLQAKRGFAFVDASRIADEIRAISMHSPVPRALKGVVVDPDDDVVVECAVLGQAKFIVSGDHHLLQIGRYQDIQILSATNFLRMVDDV